MYIQDQIEKCAKRIKDIETNPNPNFLKCNKLMYQMQLEEWLEIEEDRKTGRKPFSSDLGALGYPLGFHDIGYSALGDRVKDTAKYRELANKWGFPDKSCDRTMAAMIAYLSGDMPAPRLMILQRGSCEPLKWSVTAVAKYLGILSFEFHRLPHQGEDNVHCLTEQYGELIDFAETCIPGIKYHEEKLIEALEYQHQARPYLRDLFQLRKRVPFPLSNQDAVRLGPGAGRPERQPQGMEYLKAYHDEVMERVEKGRGRAGEENLRVIWMNTFNYGRGTMDMLTKKGVSVLTLTTGGSYRDVGYGHELFDERVYGRKLTPLEEVAAGTDSNGWGNPGGGGIPDYLPKLCQALKVDAVVDFLQVGCYVTKGLHTMCAERLKNEAGIPTLGLEGREFYMTEGEKAEMYKKLEEFIDICIANKQQKGS